MTAAATATATGTGIPAGLGFAGDGLQARCAPTFRLYCLAVGTLDADTADALAANLGHKSLVGSSAILSHVVPLISAKYCTN